MTPPQVQLVQQSFPKLAQHAIQASELFYTRLFTQHPELRQLFPADFSGQKAKFVQMLGTVVRNLAEPDTISNMLYELGKRHVSYRVTEEHYPKVGDAFIWMLARVLGPDFTPELRSAWLAAYGMISEVMFESGQVPATEEGFFADLIGHAMEERYGEAGLSEPSTAASDGPDIFHDRDRLRSLP